MACFILLLFQVYNLYMNTGFTCGLFIMKPLSDWQMILMHVKIWKIHIKHRMDGTYEMYQKCLPRPEKPPLSAPCYVRPQYRTTNNKTVTQKMQENEWKAQMRWQVNSRLGQMGDIWVAGGAMAASDGIMLAFGGVLVAACFSLWVLVACRSFHLSLIAFPTLSSSPLSWPLVLCQQLGLFICLVPMIQGLLFVNLVNFSIFPVILLVGLEHFFHL